MKSRKAILPGLCSYIKKDSPLKQDGSKIQKPTMKPTKSDPGQIGTFSDTNKYYRGRDTARITQQPQSVSSKRSKWPGPPKKRTNVSTEVYKGLPRNYMHPDDDN